MASVSKTNIFKKYRIAIVTVLAFAVALCCIIAFAGNKNEEELVVDESAAFVPSESSIAQESKELNGYGLYIDGTLVCAVESEAAANNALDEILAARSLLLNIEDAENSFNNNIELVSGIYPEQAFCDNSKLLTLLGKQSKNSFTSTVTDYNGNATSVKLSIHSEKTFTETVTLEYETKTVYTDAMLDGVKKVVNKGYNGEGEETYKIVSIDGVEYARETVSLNVTVEPVDALVRIGTCSNGIDVATLGTFVKPYDGVVTSYMGPRWGRTHKGIDIAGDRCNGKPAYAAADGVVIRADWYGGYGNCVIIDHGNGVQTLYAHLSAHSVALGDVVKAGQEIGKIGSTGNSTGPHLHFEVFVDGEIVNPLIFVNYED